MRGKVKIEVFGIGRDPQTGQNSLALKKYFSLVKYIDGSDVKGKADLLFIDTAKTNMNNYPAVKKALSQGRPTPIVVINGAIKYFGNIPYEDVYQEIKRARCW